MAAASTAQDMVGAVEGAADAAAARAPAVALCQAVEAQGSGEPDTTASLALLCAVKARCVPDMGRRLVCLRPTTNSNRIRKSDSSVPPSLSSIHSPHAFRDPAGPLPLLLAWLQPREDVRRTSAGVSRGGALYNRLACNVLLRAFRDRKVKRFLHE